MHFGRDDELILFAIDVEVESLARASGYGFHYLRIGMAPVVDEHLRLALRWNGGDIVGDAGLLRHLCFNPSRA